MKGKLPIFLSNWTFKDKKGTERTVERVIIKGNPDTIINNEVLISRALKGIRGLRKNHTFKPTNVELISQHGYGPDESETKPISKEGN